MSLLNVSDVKAYVAQFDLTPGMLKHRIKSIYKVLDPTDVTSLAEGSRLGLAMGEIEYQGIWRDDATYNQLAAYGLLGSNTDSPWSTFLGETVGNPSVHTEAKTSGLKVPLPFADLVRIEIHHVNQRAVEYGKVQYAKTTITATTSSTALDNAAESTAGGSWYYHVFAWSAAGGNARWQLSIQESSDNGADAYADKDGPYNVSAVGGARKAIAGTIERYTKFKATLDATSGSITVAAALRRA